ncbi:8546_t:CDS:1, partial [Ambispora leptoticha]
TTQPQTPPQPPPQQLVPQHIQYYGQSQSAQPYGITQVPSPPTHHYSYIA